MSILHYYADKWLYLKLCFQRSYEHIYIPVIVIQNTLLFLVLLRSYGLNKDWIALPIILLGCAALLLIGHMDIKHGLYKRETSLRNAHNEELQRAANK